MDMGEPHPEAVFEAEDEKNSQGDGLSNPQMLPPDLPTSLDDRRRVPEYAGETEIYDGWQGMQPFNLRYLSFVCFLRLFR